MGLTFTQFTTRTLAISAINKKIAEDPQLIKKLKDGHNFNEMSDNQLQEILDTIIFLPPQIISTEEFESKRGVLLSDGSINCISRLDDVFMTYKSTR